MRWIHTECPYHHLWPRLPQQLRCRALWEQRRLLRSASLPSGSTTERDGANASSLLKMGYSHTSRYGSSPNSRHTFLSSNMYAYPGALITEAKSVLCFSEILYVESSGVWKPGSRVEREYTAQCIYMDVCVCVCIRLRGCRFVLTLRPRRVCNTHLAHDRLQR